MCKTASLGLELEYSGFEAKLSVKEEEKIEEKDFKGKHIIVCDSEKGTKEEEAKDLFFKLGKSGIKVTLDTRSNKDYSTPPLRLTFELILNHEQFEITDPKTSDKAVQFNSFAAYVEEFTQYISGLPKEGITLTITFEGSDKRYNLEIPKYDSTNKVLMPHVTIPCPVYKIGCSGQSVEWQKETKESYTIPDYFREFIVKKTKSLRSSVSYPKELKETEIHQLEQHDPKQGTFIVPKTSLKTIISIIKKKHRDFSIKKEKDDVYITENLSYNQLIDNINSKNNTDLLLNNPLGIFSIGDATEKVNDIECPIFEFRRIGSFNVNNVKLFEKELKKYLYTLLFDNGKPDKWDME